MNPDSDDKLLAWQRNALEKVDALMEETKKKTKKGFDYRGARFALRVSPTFIALTHRAAIARNISLAGYIQRALARQLADDLDIPVREILAAATAPGVYDVNSGVHRYVPKGPDTGEGHGTWAWS